MRGLAVMLVFVSVWPAAAVADVRVTSDNRPGSYKRLDGGTDATQEACSTRRRSQEEPSVAVNPRDPRVVAVAAMDACHAFRFPVGFPQPQNWMGLYRSYDGGRTFDAGLFPGYPGDSSQLAGDCSLSPDPTVAFDNDGRLFVGGICWVGGYAGVGHFYIGVATFDQDGRRLVRLVRGDRHASQTEEEAYNSDKPNLTVDQTSGLHAGNVYIAFTECPRPAPGACGIGTSRLAVSRSTDQGASFSSPVAIASPDGGFPGFTDLAVGPGGTLHLVFRTEDVNGKRPLWYSSSTDGGESFSIPVRLDEISVFSSGDFSGNDASLCGDGPFACPSGFTFPQFPDGVVVAADAAGVHVAYGARTKAGQSKIFVRNSSDGLDWSTPAKQIDQSGNGHQWWPDIASADGTLSIVFLDSRVDPAYATDLPPGNTRDGKSSGPAVDTWLAQSIDGGHTWAERRLSSVSSEPNLETFIEARVPWRGDYIYLSAVPGGGYAVWVDSRDVVEGTDSREGNNDDGFDVHAPCAWDPNTVTPNPVPGPADAYISPSNEDACFNQGGLDLNIYGTSFGPATGSCTPPTGTVGRRGLGPATLGGRRAAVRSRFVSLVTPRPMIDRFCLEAGGAIRVGYPSRQLRRGLPPRLRRRVRGRSVLVLTTGGTYSARTIAVGATRRQLRRRYPRLRRHHVAANRWYLTPGRRGRLVFKLRGGRVRELGVANARLTRGRARARRFLSSFQR